ncbi:MAG: hypothetical protein QTN59_19350 [Candidatus Electrothrix communis]|nr:MAG: hypothetical protein QTN59_19350 [Candidatus Electrothrix communis]
MKNAKKVKKLPGPMTHAFFGEYKERLPGFIHKRYLKELRGLDMVSDEGKMENDA